MGMCLDCVTKASMVIEGVLPGWDLKRARETFEHWEYGSWLLSTEDGSAVISWVGEMAQEPLVCQEGDYSEEAYVNSVNAFETAAKVDPKTGWCLVQAAIECGFDPEIHELGSWIIDHFARAVKL